MLLNVSLFEGAGRASVSVSTSTVVDRLLDLRRSVIRSFCHLDS